MTSETTSGREPVTIVEIDQDRCVNVYGTAPCTAEVGVTGSTKCYNTFATCQDEANFDLGSAGSRLTLRFCSASSEMGRIQADNPVPLIPSVVSVSSNPTRLNPGGASRDRRALGERASITVEFQDAPYPDRQVDPYPDDRDFDPLTRSTFWAKWLARNPYYQNRPIRIREGYIGQTFAAMQTRSYLIEEIDGPDANGRVRVTAKDVLKLADDERAQAPAPSVGELDGPLDDGTSDTSFDVAGALIGDYAAGGSAQAFVRIGSEIIGYGSLVESSGILTFSSLTRGALGTTAESHNDEDLVQQCLIFSSDDAWEVIRDLLVDYGNVPAAYIPYSDWITEGTTWLPTFQIGAVLSEPTGVTTLITEICEQVSAFIYWDERDAEIKFRALRLPLEEPVTWDEEFNILAGSVSVSQQPEQRFSQVWIYTGQIDPTERLDEPRNYRNLRIRQDIDAESAEQYGEARIKKIFSRWLSDEGQALDTGTRLLNRFKDNPKIVTVMVDAKDRATWTGDVVNLRWRGFVDAVGQVSQIRMQVISAEEVSPGHSVRYILQNLGIAGRLARYMEEGAPDFAYASDSEKSEGAWYAEENGLMPDNSEAYTYQ